MERDELAHLLNATSPNRIELLLSLQGPGAPESLDEAAERVLRGEPVVPEADDRALEADDSALEAGEPALEAGGPALEAGGPERDGPG
jgi:hypothetical protein